MSAECEALAAERRQTNAERRGLQTAFLRLVQESIGTDDYGPDRREMIVGIMESLQSAVDDLKVLNPKLDKLNRKRVEAIVAKTAACL